MKHAFILLLGTSLSVAACSKPATDTAAARSPVAVTAVAAAESDLARPFEAGGVVRARSVATIVAKIMADVRTVHVKAGDRVRAGQTLVVLDARELEANRARAAAGHAATQQSAALAEADRQAAEAGLTLARVTHQRLSDLRARNSATQHELDEAVAGLRAAEARAKVAEARVAEAKAAIDSASAGAAAAAVAASYATLVAPFDGLITEKSVEPGSMASPGQPLVTVEDTRGFRLEVRLDESRASLVAPGGLVDVRLDPSRPSVTAAPPTPIQGRVAEVARTLDSGSHDFLVKIDLDDSAGLRSGMFGRATFQGDRHRGIGVPASAVTRRGQLAFVFVVDSTNRARLRLVNASDASADTVEIRSGLAAGERVVLDAPSALTDGTPVTLTAGAGEPRR